MIKTLICLALLAIATPAFPQDIKAVVDEGKMLYRCEMASWHGTDLFMASYKDISKVGGYFSYPTGDSTRCVFFSKDAIPLVLGTLTFDSSLSPQRVNMELTTRPFTIDEGELFLIRFYAMKEFTSNSKKFKTYEDTNPNFIPVINNGTRKVYVITGPKKEGVIIFGNDYLFTFNDNDSCTGSRALHANIIIANYAQHPEAVSGFHTHLAATGDLMTPTDICTLMLYEKYTNMERYAVISPNYISTWNCRTNELNVSSMHSTKKKKKNKKGTDE